MNPKSSHRTPSFRHHKVTGQGFVELDGTPANELENYRCALRPIRALFGGARVAVFNLSGCCFDRRAQHDDFAIGYCDEDTILHAAFRIYVSNHLERHPDFFPIASVRVDVEFFIGPEFERGLTRAILYCLSDASG